MAAACAGLGARARLWRWGGTAVARDVPQEEQLPCTPCPSGDVWMWHRRDLLQVPNGFNWLGLQVHVTAYRTLAVASLLYTVCVLFSSARFPSPLSRAIAALPAKSRWRPPRCVLAGAEREG